MKNYIWQLPVWNTFIWEVKDLFPLLSSVRLKQGKLIQKINNLIDEDLVKAEAIILEQETLKTAQIEGEKYNAESVRSSIHRRLGLDYAGLPKTERHIDGLVEVLLDASIKYRNPLTLERLFSWNAALFPTSYSGLLKIQAGSFRTDQNGPMQVVSGFGRKERVHYQAPKADRLQHEIDMFLEWWEESENKIDGIIRAGIAHFYFVTIHPFDDGNGRLARAISDMALAQDDKLAKRYYSLSSEILKEKKQYYDILEQSQKANQNITKWLSWFIECLSNALDTSEKLLNNIFIKTDFWRKHYDIELNSRQRKVLNKLLDVGKGGFKGGLTTRKYVNIVRGISRRTAVREIQNLLIKDLLLQNKGKGRSVSYDINW